MLPATAQAVAELGRIIDLPEGPERQAEMEAAMNDGGELGRLTREYLLIVAAMTGVA